LTWAGGGVRRIACGLDAAAVHSWFSAVGTLPFLMFWPRGRLLGLRWLG